MQRSMTNAMTRRPTLIALALAGLFAAGPVAAQSPAEPQPARFAVEWQLQSLHAFVAVAEAKGEYAKRGTRVALERGYGTLNTVQRVASGEVDFGFGDLNVALAHNLQAPAAQRVTIVASVYDESEAALITRNKDIRTAADLKRRRIAAPPGVSARILFPLFAQGAGLAPTDVVWQNISPNLREFVLAKSQVDGIVGSISTILPSLKVMGTGESELTVFRYADYGVELLGLGMFVRNDHLASDETRIRAVVGGSLAGIMLMLENSGDGIAALRSVDPFVEPTTEQYRWEIARDRTLLTPHTRVAGLAALQTARVERRLASLATATNSTAQLKAADVYTDRFLPPVSERALKQ